MCIVVTSSHEKRLNRPCIFSSEERQLRGNVTKAQEPVNGVVWSQCRKQFGRKLCKGGGRLFTWYAMAWCKSLSQGVGEARGR